MQNPSKPKRRKRFFQKSPASFPGGNVASNPKRNRAAALTGVFLLLLCALSLWFLLRPREANFACVAEIYQDGKLLTRISLDEVPESYTFTITGTKGGENQVEVRPGGIGIVSADCPDGLCVRQGFLSAPGIPIVCLPHRLVIQVRPADDETVSGEIDIISY
ncbi:MAG: NusG domain II-containing protein [Roseburia sp.]|nr:NusG domain II-containing protein [Roseburia sp.]MCM1099013.1 NusG domain II-containing protein [Ruminococcus flavefaciens]